MRRNQELDAVTDQLDLVGINYTIERGRHIKIKWTANGVTRTSIVAATGSDWRGTLNNKARVRRLLRQDGATLTATC